MSIVPFTLKINDIKCFLIRNKQELLCNQAKNCVTCSLWRTTVSCDLDTRFQCALYDLNYLCHNTKWQDIKLYNRKTAVTLPWTCWTCYWMQHPCLVINLTYFKDIKFPLITHVKTTCLGVWPTGSVEDLWSEGHGFKSRCQWTMTHVLLMLRRLKTSRLVKGKTWHVKEP